MLSLIRTTVAITIKPTLEYPEDNSMFISVTTGVYILVHASVTEIPLYLGIFFCIQLLYMNITIMSRGSLHVSATVYMTRLTHAPTGVWANFAPTGGGDPRRSRKLSNVARSGKRHSKAWEVYRKYFKNDVTRGHQRSTFTVIRLRLALSDK